MVWWIDGPAITFFISTRMESNCFSHRELELGETCPRRIPTGKLRYRYENTTTIVCSWNPDVGEQWVTYQLISLFDRCRNVNLPLRIMPSTYRCHCENVLKACACAQSRFEIRDGFEILAGVKLHGKGRMLFRFLATFWYSIWKGGTWRNAKSWMKMQSLYSMLDE